jgi:photosystem II stability/assembly factor-like uncharacterized protein
LENLKHILIIFLTIISFTACKKSSKDTTPNSPSPCFDGVQNNGETGVDCGGPCSPCPKQWTAVTSGTTADLFNVSFVDESNGWAAGINGTIIHSSDGGNTWSVQSSGVVDTLNSISFINSTTGWIAGTQHILKTINGGSTWNVTTTAAANQSFYTINFFDANKGWTGGSDSGWTFLDYTSTSGLNWQRKYFGQTSNQHGNIRSIEFIDQLSGFAVGAGTSDVVLETSDGNTWASMNLPQHTFLYGCDFTSSSDGWCVGDHNYVYDVGLNQWRFQSALPDSVTLRAIKNVNTGQGWAVGNFGTVYKRDGSQSWTIVSNISTTNNLYSVSVSGTTGCIVGQGGVVLILK